MKYKSIKRDLTLAFLSLSLSSCQFFKALQKNKSESVKVKSEKLFSKTAEGALQGPCVNLPFVDQYFPELLHQVIGLYQPKVSRKDAYSISIKSLNKAGSLSGYRIKATSAKLCKTGKEYGYSFTFEKKK